MNTQDRLKALEVIENRQQDCASVEVSIGGTRSNNMVEHDSLYITKCPPCIIDELRERGFSLAMTDDGVKVRKH